MKRKSSALIFVLFAFVLTLTFSGNVWAGDGPNGYPTKPVTLTVPWGAGGGADTTARTLSAVANQYLGQPLVVVLKPGASGTIAHAEYKKEKPDGYNLIITTNSPIVTVPQLRKVPYDPLEDFKFIIRITNLRNVLCVNKNSKYKTVEEFKAYAKAHPGEISVGHSGTMGIGHMTIKLMDCSGEVEGRIWDRVDELSARFNKDDFVQVAGKASVYMGKMQLVLQELDRLEESVVDLADFLPVSARPAAEMAAELTSLVAGLADPALRQLMLAFLEDHDFMAGYTRAPAAKTMHHVYLGGLLEHSLSVAVLADDISRRYPDLNRDLLVVGALLHDVGKVAELRYQRSFEYTDAGKLLGHIVIGVEMVEEKLRSTQDFPLELAIHLKHLLLSHHGQYEYGSPKRPKTMEAVILNFLDDLDSKINGVRTHSSPGDPLERMRAARSARLERIFALGCPVNSWCLRESISLRS